MMVPGFRRGCGIWGKRADGITWIVHIASKNEVVRAAHQTLTSWYLPEDSKGLTSCEAMKKILTA
jgi:hypothetical protein